MFIKIIIGLIVLVGVVLVYAYFQPSEYVISRQITINKPAEAIFPYINNSKMMEQWAPWPDIDPDLKMNYSGPESGVGAKASWDSKGKMGAGSATVFESIANQAVRTKLEYTRPFAMNQEAEITIATSGAQSIVKWSAKGNNIFIQRVVCLVMDMDKMVGGNFDTGLNKLKVLVEATK